LETCLERGAIGSSEVDEAESGKALANGAERVELFNLAADPYEKQNLAAERPEKADELRALRQAGRRGHAAEGQAKARRFQSPEGLGRTRATLVNRTTRRIKTRPSSNRYASRRREW